MKPILRTQAHQWIRHLVRLAVLAFIIVVPFLANYRNFIAANQLETIRSQETRSLPRSAVLKLDDFFHASREGSVRDDPQTQRAETLARLKKIRGNNWSAEIYGLSLTDPLAGTESLAAGKKFNRSIFLGMLIPVAATLVLGRFFCSWICPAGFLFEMADKVRAFLARMHVPVHNTTLWHGNKYVLLTAGLALSFVFGLPLLGFFYPPALLGREIHGAVDSFFRNLVDDPTNAGAISLTAVSLFLFVIVLVEVFVSRRMWCRYLCPGGALYTLLGALRLVRVGNHRPRCTHCTECVKICPMGLNPMGNDTPGPECDQCLACLGACEPGSLSLEFFLKKHSSRGKSVTSGESTSSPG